MLKSCLSVGLSVFFPYHVVSAFIGTRLTSTNESLSSGRGSLHILQYESIPNEFCKITQLDCFIREYQSVTSKPAIANFSDN